MTLSNTGADVGESPFEDDAGAFDVDVSGPITAYKLARVYQTEPGVFRYMGIGVNLAYDSVSEAVCGLNPHHAPTADCGCGFWGMYEVADLSEATSDVARDGGYRAFARLTVELSGKCELHDLGVRGQKQRVIAVAFPKTCAYPDCDGVAETLVVSPLSRRDVIGPVKSMCGSHVGKRDQRITCADVANSLGVEVTMGRDVSLESRKPSKEVRMRSVLVNKTLRNGRSAVGILVRSVLILALFAGVAVVGSLIGASFSWSTGTEDLSGLVNVGSGGAGQVLVYDERPVAVWPIRHNSKVVGGAVYDLGTKSCKVVLARSAPASYLANLGKIGSGWNSSLNSDGTTGSVVPGFATNSSTGAMTSFNVVTASTLKGLLDQNPRYAVGHVAGSTQSACAGEVGVVTGEAKPGGA
jgi:hypothetical protein